MHPKELTPKAKRTRAAILTATREIIGESSVSAVNIASICTQANVGRTSFYTYFADSDAVIGEVAQIAGQEVTARFEVLHCNEPRGLKRLKACIRTILLIPVEDRQSALLLASLAQHTPDLSRLLCHEIAEELNGARETQDHSLTETECQIRAQFLSVALLAVVRDLARGALPSNQVEDYIGPLMAAATAR